MSVKRHARQWATLEADEGEFELNFEPIDDTTIELVGDYAVVGYLIVDDSGGSWEPGKDNDDWAIYSAHRERRDDHGPMQEALGLDSNWEPDIEQFEDQASEKVAQEAIIALLAQHAPHLTFVEMDYNDLNGGSFTYCDTNEDQEFVMDFEILARYTGNGRWISYLVLDDTWEQDIDWEAEAKRMWDAARESGEIGCKYAVSLDVYEHSSVHYSVSGEGMQCMWDTARGGAVWVPDDSLVKELDKLPEAERWETAVKYARSAAEEYTDWSNGWVYDTVVEWFKNTGTEEEPIWEAIDYDICGGHIGNEWAEEALKEVMKDKISELREKATEVQDGD